jgi:hypothetical protein
MTYRGHIKNGRVVLKKPVKIPEGIEVEVSVKPVKRAKKAAPKRRIRDVRKLPTLHERLKDVIGKAEGLPADFSVNFDHYIYGAPKQKP